MGLTQVSTDGVKNDAITKTKIPANQIEASELADNAVDTNAIADQAVALSKLPHGDGSSDGKFLRANNGADPTFETVDTTPSFGSQNISTTGTLNCGQITTTANIELSSSDPVIAFTDTDNNDDFSIRGGGGLLKVRSDTDAADRLVIDSSGKVGIKTSSPIGTLDVYDGTFCLTKPSGDASSRNWRFVPDNAAAGNLGLQVSTASGGTTFSNIVEINSSGNVGIGEIPPADNRVRITSPHQYNIVAKSSNGNGSYHNFTGVSSGGSITSYITHNGRVGAADGIIFGSDTAAANILDDYEEGTWTPTAHGYTASNTSNNCFYTKIGRLVIASFRMTWPSLTSNSYAEIRGLPFTARNQGVSTHGGAFAETNDSQNLSLIVVENSTICYILHCASSGVTTQTISQVSTKDFRGNIIYFTDQ